jgi:hypothetical protein
VVPPLGMAPYNAPQPGSRGGGALPDTDPYAKSLAPPGTVPVAVYPPFSEYKRYPTKCVIFSQRTDFEKYFNNTEDYDYEVCQLCYEFEVDYV